MYTPALFRDRPRPVQVIIGGVSPAVVVAVAGILIGVSSARLGQDPHPEV
jgi:hypothetical protein